MNKCEEQLVHLLKLGIHHQVWIDYNLSFIGEELFILALQQDISSFLYFIINKHREKVKLDEKIMRQWKETTLYIAVRQISMINDRRTILSLFKNNNIPVISLKGLAIKQLYPQLELRNMGDIDLLIAEKDIQKSIKLLSTLGFYPNSEDLYNPRYMHIEMKREGSFPVELHRTLWHPRIMETKNDGLWLNHIWENKRIANIEGFEFTALSLEDELINLIVHLARHIMRFEAKLRQFCDIVFFIETHWYSLDLEYIEETIKSMNLYIFYQNLLVTLQLYLGLKIPINYEISDINKYKELINLMFNSTRTHNPYHTKKIPIRFAPISKMGNKTKVIIKEIPYMSEIIFHLKAGSRADSLCNIGLYLKF